MADVPKGLGDERCGIANEALDGELPRDRSDLDATHQGDAVELANAVHVHENRRQRQAQVHERNQALASREHLRLVTVLGERVNRFFERLGLDVPERRGLHRPCPLPLGRSMGLYTARRVRSP